MKTDVAACPNCGADRPPRVGNVVCHCSKETSLRGPQSLMQTEKELVGAVLATIVFGIVVFIMAWNGLGEALRMKFDGRTRGETSAAEGEDDQIRRAMELGAAALSFDRVDLLRSGPLPNQCADFPGAISVDGLGSDVD